MVDTVTILSNRGLIPNVAKEHLKARFAAMAGRAATDKRPRRKQVPIEQRTEENIAAYPCPARGEQIRVQKKKGACQCSDAPIFRCSHEISNTNSGECSLWRFSQSQSLVCCNRCPVREKLIDVPS